MGVPTMRSARHEVFSPWVDSHDRCTVVRWRPGVALSGVICHQAPAGWWYSFEAYGFLPACEEHMEIPAGDDGRPDWRRAGQAALAMLADRTTAISASIRST